MLAALVLLSGAYTPCGPVARRVATVSVRPTMGYVPDGMTAEQYAQIKAKEAAKKNLGATGTNRFQSRRYASVCGPTRCRGRARNPSHTGCHLISCSPRKLVAH